MTQFLTNRLNVLDDPENSLYGRGKFFIEGLSDQQN